MANAGEGKEIVEVEVSTDNGAIWQSAEILNSFIPNVWKHWKYQWIVKTPGRHTIFARVIDRDGNMQNEDGLYGWWGYKIFATVSPEIDCEEQHRADLTKDGYIDFLDYSLLADQWLMSGEGLAGDITPAEGDAEVDIFDLMLLADYWLAGVQ
jgi:hypothetical protein